LDVVEFRYNLSGTVISLKGGTMMPATMQVDE
jgi:hypothetical protein